MRFLKFGQTQPIDRLRKPKKKIRERNRNKRVDKATEKKARHESIQNERDHKTRVWEMALGDNGPRALIDDNGGFESIPLSIIDSVLDDVTVTDKSGTRPEGLHADLMSWRL